ncbi:hypothetical protein Q3A66_01720 [Hymenobacter sp. BT770]|uniref:hypothetical protein n=1 Tax=Hymenobacter sp. BT770 TaxID=2886942 RepID=UPI001D1272FB|nr:hypothetical protein [Hymenobacter sp. BT770]MCC3151653.1 hypothetical protein [Hymenobacter sp. BT770]MDO3413770.1 hypothetical protein [Hymenobacter sp. BT770]
MRLPLLFLALVVSFAVMAKPEPQVFKTGHYRLADGVVRHGLLCLVSDNELLVKSPDSTQPKKYAAVAVKNFVMAADSFTVLRDFDVEVNGVVTRYPYSMVQVCVAGNALKVYRIEGPMDVLITQKDVLDKNILRGAASGAIGIATGMMADKMNGVSPGNFKQQTLSLFLMQQTGGPLVTLQPKTRRALDVVKATIADDAELSKSFRTMSSMTLTNESILNVLTHYHARAIIRQTKP